MGKEIERKIFCIEEYQDKEQMEEEIKKYVKIMEERYPYAAVTREFYDGRNILVRVAEIGVAFHNRNFEQGRSWRR